ncbi:MAG: S8 family serine peptidase [Candidatus Obscuribacterales bacterium]|jgi:hypothetical protein|nr:S8 family serine peptidase [Candidatus Obscuribacterales bacterium]
MKKIRALKQANNIKKALTILALGALSISPALAQQANFQPNDPQLQNCWHLGEMRVPQGWNVSSSGAPNLGRRNIAVIVDQSVGSGNTDFRILPSTFQQINGYGRPATYDTTKMLTAGFAQADNGFATAGIAPSARVQLYTVNPLKDEDRQADDAGLARAVDAARNNPHVRLIAVCVDRPTMKHDANSRVIPSDNYRLVSNPDRYPRFHDAAKRFYDAGGLLVVNTGATGGLPENTPRVPYMMSITGINQSHQYPAWSTGIGKNVWFALPGDGVFCSDEGGNVVQATTSKVATTMAAGVFALVWNANPQLTNIQVQDVVARTATRLASPVTWTPDAYGYGIPNCEAACNLATIYNLRLPPQPRPFGLPSRRPLP